MRTPVVLILILALAFAASVAAPALAEAKPQTTCAVMGGMIDKAVFADHEGLRVYFCCPGCIDTFKADPARFLGKFKAEGVELEKAPAVGDARNPQTLCPVLGNPVDRKVFADVEGFRVHFCCADCIEKFKAAPAKHFARVKSAGVTLAKAPAPGTERDPDEGKPRGE